MAMILCPECGKDISDRAVACPHCGFPIGSLHGDDTVYSNSAGNDYADDSINPKTNPADTIKCRVCGSTMAKGQRICKTCGSIVKETEPNYYNEPYAYNNTSAAPVSTVNAKYSSISDIFIWLLSVGTVLAIGIDYFKAPIYTFVFVWILNLVSVILDYKRLEKAGIQVNRLCFVLGALLLYPIYVLARTVKTKRVFPGVVYFAVFVALVLFSVRGLIGNTSKELLNYINNDMQKLAITENEMRNSYNSVMGDHYSDDYTAYIALKNVTLPAANRLISEANTVYNNLSSKEIKEVHMIYIDFCNTYCEAFEYILEGIEQQNTATVQKGNRKLESTAKLASDYQNGLKRLANKYGVKWYIK